MDGDVKLRVADGAKIFAVEFMWGSDLLSIEDSKRGAELDRPLGIFGALELRLVAVPLA